MDGWTDGRMNGWMEGGKTLFKVIPFTVQKKKERKKETDERKLRCFFHQKQIANPTLRILEKKLIKNKWVTYSQLNITKLDGYDSI